MPRDARDVRGELLDPTICQEFSSTLTGTLCRLCVGDGCGVAVVRLCVLSTLGFRSVGLIEGPDWVLIICRDALISLAVELRGRGCCG